MVVAVSAAFGQTYRQGDVIRVWAAPAAKEARMSGRTIPLFVQADGRAFGLMPVPVEATPGPYTLEYLGAGGVVLGSKGVTVRDAKFRIQNVVMKKETAELRSTPAEAQVLKAFRETVSDTRRWREPLRLPVPGCMISPFGVRRFINGKPTGGYHGGLDQRSPAGRPVRAVAGGTVKMAGVFTLLGGTVGIDHGQGLESIYMHLSKLATREGVAVEKGEVIGYVGSTGRSTGPHLHWALLANGVQVNPRQWVVVRPCGNTRKPEARSQK